jgi:hypothetical protein
MQHTVAAVWRPPPIRDDTDGKEKKKFGKQELFIREIREIRGKILPKRSKLDRLQTKAK